MSENNINEVNNNEVLETINELMSLAQQAVGMGNNQNEYSDILAIAEAYKKGLKTSQEALDEARAIINSKNEV